MKILAIDPGETESAFVLLDKNLKPLWHGKVENKFLLDTIISSARVEEATDIAIEMIASYGMPVGKEVFDTVFWIGRFWEAAKYFEHKERIYRMEEKDNLCHSRKANDSNIMQALIDRFAPGVPNKGKGSKKNPGFFYRQSKRC